MASVAARTASLLAYPDALAAESHAAMAVLAACAPVGELYLAGSAALALTGELCL